MGKLVTFGVALLVYLIGGCQAPAHRTIGPPIVKQMNVNGASLTYLEQGSGVPVVFVHPIISDHRAWDNQREAVAQHYRFITFDQRYFGIAAWPDKGEKFLVPTHIEDLAAFIKGLNYGPVHLIGWSYGGGIVLDVARRNPDLVRSVFVYEVGSSLTSHVTNADDLRVLGEERKQLAPAAAAAKAGDNAGATRQLLDWVNRQTGVSETLAPAIRSMNAENARTLPATFAAPPPPAVSCANLAEIKAPVTIAVGTLTRPFFKILSETASRCIPGSRLVAVPNARHLAPYENPPAINEALLVYLRQQ